MYGPLCANESSFVDFDLFEAGQWTIRMRCNFRCGVDKVAAQIVLNFCSKEVVLFWSMSIVLVFQDIAALQSRDAGRKTDVGLEV